MGSPIRMRIFAPGFGITVRSQEPSTQHFDVEAATGNKTPAFLRAKVRIPSWATPRGPREPSTARQEFRLRSSRWALIISASARAPPDPDEPRATRYPRPFSTLVIKSPSLLREHINIQRPRCGRLK